MRVEVRRERGSGRIAGMGGADGCFDESVVAGTAAGAVEGTNNAGLGSVQAGERRASRRKKTRKWRLSCGAAAIMVAADSVDKCGACAFARE